MSKKQKSLLIGGLCTIVLLMVIGYAAFSSVLNIQGTTNISSNWNIKITNVTSKDIVGSASNQEEPSWENLTATFNTNLVSPGDSITYEITVSNAGTLNAKLDKITLSDTSNPAIKFETSGLTEGDILNAGSNTTLNVKVSYDINVSSDPVNKVGELTVTLDYSQADGSGSSSQTAAEQLIATTVTSGDGLYQDDYGYIYKGANPNNYITFNNEVWRILSVQADGTIKIVKNTNVRDMVWDSTNINNWTRPASLNTYLNEEYYNSLTDIEFVLGHDWNVGTVSEHTNLAELINDENSDTYYGWVGLISLSEYLRASTNDSQCNHYELNNTNYEMCRNINWLFNSSNQWTLSSYIYSSSQGVFNIGYDGCIYGYNASFIDGVRPALYLRPDLSLTGSGTSNDPYILSGIPDNI